MSRYTFLRSMTCAFALMATACATYAAELPGGLRVLPVDAARLSVSGTTTINGLPSRLLGFESREALASVAALYEREWGKPIVRNQVGEATVLGKAVDGTFVTVKLEPLRSGTRGIISVTHLSGDSRAQQSNQRELKAWLHQLGSGARLVHHAGSQDIGQQSTSFLFSAQMPEKELARRGTQVLTDQGFQAEREFQDAPARTRTDQGKDGVVRLFKSTDGGEAILTVFRHSDGRSYLRVQKISIQ